MTNRKTSFTFIICGAFHFVSIWSSVVSAKEPVANINGKTITEVDLDHYLLKINSSVGDYPKESQTLLQIKQAALAELIAKEFYSQLLESENLTVSEEELDHEFKQMLSSLPKEAIEEIKLIVDAVRQALAAWHADPANERQIYETHLLGIMSYPDWGAYQNAYDDVLNGIPEAVGWKEYLKVMSRKGLIKQIEWQKLKQKTTKHVHVEEAEVREEYERSHPRVKWWDVLHFFHIQKDIVRQAANSLPQEKKRQEILTEFRSLPDNTGGVIKDRIINKDYFPYYAEGIHGLKEGQVGPITFGVFNSGSNRKSWAVESADQFFHVLFVEHIEYQKALSFKKVKPDIENHLLKVKREAVWQDWLINQYNNADINVMDKRFKVPEFSDQYNMILKITPSEAIELSTELNQNDTEPLPPPGAVGH